MKKNNIPFIDRIGLAIRTYRKEYARIYRFKYDKHLERKIHKLIHKRKIHNNKWQKIYDNELEAYNKYISYLQYKVLHNGKH